MKRIKIERRAYEHEQRKNDYNAADYLVDYDNAAVVKLVSYLVDKPRQPEPPQQRTANNAEISHTDMQRMLGDDEGELGKRRHKKEYD